MGNSTCQQEIHLNFPCAVPTICIKCVARKYECQSRAEQGQQIHKYTLWSVAHSITQVVLGLTSPPRFPQLLVCVCDTLKPCPAACCLHVATEFAYGQSRRQSEDSRNHIASIKRRRLINNAQIYLALSLTHSLSLSRTRTVIKLHIHICSIMPRIIYIYECSRLKQFDALT